MKASRTMIDNNKKPPLAIKELLWAVFAVLPSFLVALNSSTIPDGTIIFGIVLCTPCAYRMFFHVPCPSCGLTRAIIESLHLNFVASWGYHWAGLWIIIGVVVFAVWRMRRFLLLFQHRIIDFSTEKVFWGKIGIIYVIGFAILTVGNWFYHLFQ
jgi:hypothetical protein